MNMSYCRFRNTRLALEDCAENINEPVSKVEDIARKALIKLAFEIVTEFMDDEGKLDENLIDKLPTE